VDRRRRERGDLVRACEQLPAADLRVARIEELPSTTSTPPGSATEDAAIFVDGVTDVPSTVPEQLAWLDEAGYEARYVHPDLAVFVARRRPR
jgi:hypothetical protein